jgi:hypothetical protein
MRGTEIASGDCLPLNVVPCFANGGENPGERAASIIAEKPDGIFRHKESWAESRNNSETLAPHPSFVICAFPFAGQADRLAWNASGNQVNAPGVAVIGRERLDLSPPTSIGPMSCQDGRGVFVSLHLPFANHPGAFEAEVKASDACEQRTKSQRLPFHAARLRRSSTGSMLIQTQRVCTLWV